VSFLFFISDLESASEESEGEDIEGVEYASRFVDASESGQSLQGFFDDHDSGSIQGPSFYRALDNEDSLSSVQIALRSSGKKKRAAVSCTYQSAWSSLLLASESRRLISLIRVVPHAAANHGLVVLYRMNCSPFYMRIRKSWAAISESGFSTLFETAWREVDDPGEPIFKRLF
jgi:hypothetical protein